MREIKFRAWDMITIPNRMKSWSQLLAQYQLTQVLSSDKFKLMQYIGLKDKNGVEIYEGDIVEAWNYNKKIKGVVEYCELECLYCIGKDPIQYFVSGTATDNPTTNIQVVGNIHKSQDNTQ